MLRNKGLSRGDWMLAAAIAFVGLAAGPATSGQAQVCNGPFRAGLAEHASAGRATVTTTADCTGCAFGICNIFGTQCQVDSYSYRAAGSGEALGTSPYLVVTLYESPAGRFSTTDCQQANACGDGVCDTGAGESNATCSADCPTSARCGDGICNGNETQASCSADCATIGTPTKLKSVTVSGASFNSKGYAWGAPGTEGMLQYYASTAAWVDLPLPIGARPRTMSCVFRGDPEATPALRVVTGTVSLERLDMATYGSTNINTLRFEGQVSTPVEQAISFASVGALQRGQVFRLKAGSLQGGTLFLLGCTVSYE